jgi:hypothetical protein
MCKVLLHTITTYVPMLQDPLTIEQQLQEIITRLKREKKINIALVKQWIYESDDEDSMRATHLFQKKFMQAFGNVKEADFEEVVELCMHCWNVFPHKALGGISPQEKYLEYYGKEAPEDMEEVDIDPIMNVGPHKIRMSEYEKMAADIERAQKPLKQWAENTILPLYIKRLHKCYSRQTVEKHQEVAEMFIDKVLSSGYTNYEDISVQFCSWFSDWWETHVLYSNLTPDQVWRSLMKFIEFIFDTTGKDISDDRNKNDEDEDR